MLDRRAFLAASVGTLGATLVSRPVPAGAAAADGHPAGDEELFASCVRTDDDRYAVAVVEAGGRIRTLHPLPARGHDVAFDPVGGRCIAFARRPGTFAVVFDAAGREPPEVITAAPGRHFFGHGVFTADGGTLYATENAIAGGRGLIGIYDVAGGFARVGEIETGGIGPHELVWAADGRTLVIANGGIDTDPTFGRRNLNIADMKSGLALIDPGQQRVVGRTAAGRGLEALSIRHLAVDANGAVWLGCQFEGDPTDHPPLIGRLSPDGALEMIELPVEARRLPRNYIGSVAVSADGGTIAMSAPKGGVILGFDAATRAFVGTLDLRDGCGLAPANREGLIATSGTGRVEHLVATVNGLAVDATARAPTAFDNHLVRLS